MIAHTHSADETYNLAERFSAQLVPGSIVALTGNLGAGKTTFVQGLASALGVTVPITSPTFVLLQSYEIPHGRFVQTSTMLNHIDLYRLDSIEEIRGIGIEEILSDRSAITVIEWPERAPSLLPGHTIWVSFRVMGDGLREILFESNGL